MDDSHLKDTREEGGEMSRITNIILFVCFALLVGSCTKQRDLHVVSNPLLLIENDFEPSKCDIDNGATVMIYDRPDDSPTELMPDALRKIVGLDKGLYDILVFNGLMYSHLETHLDNIYYRGTDRFETFEAVITEMPPSSRFRAKQGEVIVSSPDILTTHSTSDHDIAARRKFEMKYRNGKNGYPVSRDLKHIDDTVSFSPCRVTHTCQVIARVRNPKSARVVQAKLHGFAQSVFLADRMPAHNSITHQFTLNSLKLDPTEPDIGTISSPVFTTFGPPLDLPGRRYTIDVNVLLTNSYELETMTFDVTDQVEQSIAYLSAERLNSCPIMDTFYIYIDYELPIVISDGLDVGVGDWGNDVIITVPIEFK